MSKKSGISVIRFIAVAACAYAAGLAPAWAEQKCTGFGSYADGTQLPEIFRKNGFRFDFGDRETTIFDRAAVFHDADASVKLAFAGKKTHLVIIPHTAAWTSVKALDAAGNVVGAFEEGPPYANPLVIDFVSSGADIVKLAIDGGGNESGIRRVCVTRD